MTHVTFANQRFYFIYIDEHFPTVLKGIDFGGGDEMVFSLQKYSLLSNDLKYLQPDATISRIQDSLHSQKKMCYQLSRTVFPVILSSRYAHVKSEMQAEDSMTSSIFILSFISPIKMIVNKFRNGRYACSASGCKKTFADRRCAEDHYRNVQLKIGSHCEFFLMTPAPCTST